MPGNSERVWQMAGRVFIRGQLVVISDLHIGGDVLNIPADQYFAAPDNPIIRDALGNPLIPGSSYRGRMRSELDLVHHAIKIDPGMDSESNRNKNPRREGNSTVIGRKNKAYYGAVLCPEPDCWVEKVFGRPADSDFREPTRLQVCDARLSGAEAQETTTRIENAIHRIFSAANPRKSEYVPVGTSFDFQLIYTVFDSDDVRQGISRVLEGMELVDDTGLGGGRSRGAGMITHRDIKFVVKTRSDYIEGNGGAEVFTAENIREFRRLFKEKQSEILRLFGWSEAHAI